jgi:uncharacterized membrane protein YdcZ (DUF606 family)
MTELLYVLLAAAIGVGASLQVAMVASVGRDRGAYEGAWVNMLGAIMLLCAAFVVRAWRSEPPSLPAPLDGPLVFGIAAAIFAAALALSLRGLNPALGVAGFFGFAYLVSAGFLAPRIGIALFASAVTAGTLTSSVVLDHVGAFGTDVQRLGATRLLGVIALLVGVVLVRTHK